MQLRNRPYLPVNVGGCDTNLILVILSLPMFNEKCLHGMLLNLL